MMCFLITPLSGYLAEHYYVKKISEGKQKVNADSSPGQAFSVPTLATIPFQDSNLISVPVETLTWPVVRQMFTWGFC